MKIERKRSVGTKSVPSVAQKSHSKVASPRKKSVTPQAKAKPGRKATRSLKKEVKEDVLKESEKPVTVAKRPSTRRQTKRGKDEEQSEPEPKVDSEAEMPSKATKKLSKRKKADTETETNGDESESIVEHEAARGKTRQLRKKTGKEDQGPQVDLETKSVKQPRGRKRVLDTKNEEKDEVIIKKRRGRAPKVPKAESETVKNRGDALNESKYISKEEKTVGDKKTVSVVERNGYYTRGAKKRQNEERTTSPKSVRRRAVTEPVKSSKKLSTVATKIPRKSETTKTEIRSKREVTAKPGREKRKTKHEADLLILPEKPGVEPEVTEQENESEVTEKETEPEVTEQETELEVTEKETEPEVTEQETEPEVTEQETEPEVAKHEIEPEVTKEEIKPNLTKEDIEPQVMKPEALEISELIENKTAIRVKDLPVCKLPDVSGQLMTFGEDTCGELGLSELGISKTKPTIVEGLSSVASVTAGAMHTVCLKKNGEVLTFGCNDECALGRTTSNDNEAIPLKAFVNVEVVKVTAGDSHTVALTSLGCAYFWGNYRDQNGRIGLTQETTDSVLDPTPVKIDTTFVDIASGCNHSLFLSEKGEVYTIGVGEQGALGRLPEAECKFAKDFASRFLIPRKIVVSKNEVFDKVWAGSYTSFARTVTGKVYAWGLNNFCQLGFRSNPAEETAPSVEYFPRLLPSFTRSQAKVTHICGGTHHSLALDEEGRVYSCGRCEYGRLGHGENVGDEETFKMVDSLKDKIAVYICCGPVNSFAVTDDGSLYAWGMASTNLGVGGGEIDLHVPTLVTAKSLANRSVLAVTSGSQHTAIIATSGDGNHNGN